MTVFVLGCGASGTQEGREWISSQTSQPSEDAGVELPLIDSCEVIEVRRLEAVEQLRAQSILPIDETTRQLLVADCLHSEKGKTLYLVRAVYGHRGTGRYFVRRIGDDLYVLHGSLGRYDTFSKSALVVNLGFVPRRVIVKASIDE